jgi:DUF1680 family protein
MGRLRPGGRGEGPPPRSAVTGSAKRNPVDHRIPGAALRLVPHENGACPPNVVRTLAQLQTMAYSKSADTIWVNLFGGSEYTTEMKGVKVKITQETQYPWDSIEFPMPAQFI